MADFSAYGGPSAEWLALAATLPAEPAFANVDEMKLAANKVRDDRAAVEMETLSRHVTTKDHAILSRDGYILDARSYRAATRSSTERLPVYLYIHGGGFLLGTLNSHDPVCSRIAIATPVVVVSINYRHTPDFGYPCAWDDVEDAFDWVHAHLDEIGGDGTRVVVGGTSAGGLLAASLVLGRHVRGDDPRPKIAGQVLMIPVLVHAECREKLFGKMKDRALSSVYENEHAAGLPLKKMQAVFQMLNVASPDPTDKRLNPGNADPEDVMGLPPTTIGVAGYDVLRDDGLLYAQLLADNGVPTNVTVFRGVPHGFRRYGDKLSASSRWDEAINDGIRWALSRPTADQFEIKVVE